MLLAEFLDFIFPPRCLACARYLESHTGCCEDCFASVRVHDAFFCGTCRARLPDNRKTCHRDSPFMLAIAATYRDPVVKALVIGLKFDAVRPGADVLALLASRYFLNIPLPPGTVFVPVPLGARRRRLRGFNQSELIAERLASKLGLAVRPEWLARVRETPPQTDLDHEARLKNVAGSFRASPAVRGENIILLDDVVTSGATLRAAAEAVRSEGGRIVCAAAVAGA